MTKTDRDFLARFLPSIATQLRSALGNIHFAAAALVPPEARESDPVLDKRAALLDQSYYQLLRLVNNLSAAAHLNDEGKTLELRDTDIVEAVREVYEDSCSLAVLLHLDLSFHPAMPSHLCAFDRELIQQLLFQLLSNAFKYTPKGGCVTIEVKPGDGQVLVCVNDTGCGISPELLSTLFERYLHEERITPEPQGLGLGLPLCRRIAEEHGGNLVAESKEGAGTRITLSLPDKKIGVSGVSDVAFDYSGGFNHTLLNLADALPPEAFRLRNQD